MFFTRCSSSKEALTTFIYYSILRNFRPTCLRASSRVCCYFWLMTSSAVGLFVLARVTSLFFVSSCSMCVCDDWTPVYWFMVCYLLCLFMPGRVSRDMGLVWFLISCFCWFVSFIRFIWSCPGVLAGTWGWCVSLFPISIDLIFFNRFGWFLCGTGWD